MIHGQLGRRKSVLTVITNPLSQLLLPPLGLAQFTGLGFFLLLMFRTRRRKENLTHETYKASFKKQRKRDTCQVESIRL